jgi:hypothetical protein
MWGLDLGAEPALGGIERTASRGIALLQDDLQVPLGVKHRDHMQRPRACY